MKGSSIFKQPGGKRSPADFRTFTEFQQANLQHLSLKFPFLGKSQLRAKLKEQWTAFHKSDTKCPKVRKKGKQRDPTCVIIEEKMVKEDDNDTENPGDYADNEDDSYSSSNPLPHNYCEKRDVVQLSDTNDSVLSTSSTTSSHLKEGSNCPEERNVNDPSTELNPDENELHASPEEKSCELSEQADSGSLPMNEPKVLEEGTCSNSQDGLINEEDIDFKISPIPPDKTNLFCRRPKWGRSRLRLRKTPRGVLRDITNEYSHPIVLDGSSEDETGVGGQEMRKGAREKIVSKGIPHRNVPHEFTKPLQQEDYALADDKDEDEDDEAKWNRLLMRRGSVEEADEDQDEESVFPHDVLLLNDSDKENIVPTSEMMKSLNELRSQTLISSVLSPNKENNPRHEDEMTNATAVVTMSKRRGKVKKNVKTKVKEWEEATVDENEDDDGDSGFLTDLFRKPTEVSLDRKFKTPSIGLRTSLERTRDMFAGNCEELFG